MRIVVTGATGNVGTSVLEALAAEDAVDEIVGLARRLPDRSFPKTTFRECEVSTMRLDPLFAGADAVIHLAWLIQPGHDEATTEQVNVTGSRRVFEAAARAGVPRLVYASSVGAYSPGPKTSPVDESWPVGGIPTSFYSRHKAAVEAILDEIESAAYPEMRVVRLRPGLIFKREAATGIRRLFAGPFLPEFLLDRRRLPIVPAVNGLLFQVVHSDDVGEAYRLAALHPDAHGAYNVAVDPVVTPNVLAGSLGARALTLPSGLTRRLADASFRLRLQPTEPGWLDLALGIPTMNTARVRDGLGWAPRMSAPEVLREVVDGMRAGADLATPPLARGTSGPARVRELLTGVGARSR